MPDPDESRGWAPLDPSGPDVAPAGPSTPAAPTVPPATAPSGGGYGSWAPPQTAPGWGAPTPPPYGAPPPYPGPSTSGPYGAPAAGYGAPGPGGYGPPPNLPKGGDARTGPLPLHPMSVGDVLDGAFKLLKANARTIVLVVAAIVVPVQLISAFVVRDQVSVGLLGILQDPTLADPDSSAGFGTTAASLVTTVLGLLTGPFIAGAVSRVVAASYLGSHLGPAAALQATARRFGSLLAATVLVFLVQAIGFVLCIVPGLLAFALYTAVTPAVMIEEIGPIQAMRRSWRLMQPRMWQVLGIAVLARMIAGLLGNLVGGIPSAVAVLLGGSFAWLFIAVGSTLSSLVTAPIVAIVSTLLYFDGRIRHEGFDLQIMARDLERSAAG